MESAGSGRCGGRYSKRTHALSREGVNAWIPRVNAWMTEWMDSSAAWMHGFVGRVNAWITEWMHGFIGRVNAWIQRLKTVIRVWINELEAFQWIHYQDFLCQQLVGESKKYILALSFSNHFSLTSMQNGTRSRKDGDDVKRKDNHDSQRICLPFIS